MYVTAIFLGVNLSGMIASLLELFLIYLNPSSRVLIIYYLIFILAIYLIAFDLHFALPLNTYYQHYHRAVCTPANSTSVSEYLLYLLLYISTCLTYTIYPVVIQDTSPLSDIFTNKSFTLMVCYLSFYLSTFLGIFASTFSRLPCSWLPVLIVTVRFILLPLFLFSNYLPDTRVLVVLVQWDWTFALLLNIFSFLGGFVLQLLVVAILRVGRNVETRSVLSMRCCGVIMLGRLTGIAFSFLHPGIVS